MAQVTIAPRAQDDLDRLFEFLVARDPVPAREALGGVLEAISVLRGHPLIGRPLDDDLRELVISRGKSGYVALYRFFPQRNLVRVLAIRHQREAGYPD